jgi:hypothetical protein
MPAKPTDLVQGTRMGKGSLSESNRGAKAFFTSMEVRYSSPFSDG